MAGAADDILRRVPPNNLEAEQSVLGAILLLNEAINHAIEILAAEDFYRESHRQIFQSMVELTDRGEPVDAITLTDILRNKGLLEQIGGSAYIAELASVVPTASNVPYYARIVREKSVLRSLASIATDIASSAYGMPSDVDAFLDQAEHRIFEIAERRIRPSFHSMKELTKDSLGILERMYQNRDLITGVPSGFIDLDRITAGFQPSDLVIIAARPSMGKTALALNIASYAAMAADPPVGVAFFSLEMSREQLALRMLCSEARVDSARARSGYLGEKDFPRLAGAAARLSEASIYVDDNSNTTALTLKAKCRRLKRERAKNLGLIIVDYLQLMGSAKPGENREKEIAEISRSLKALAKELQIPVIALSQLNRQVESRENRRPMLADLRESGALEQDADVIAFIYREEMYKGKDSKEPGVAEVIIAKQRNGPTDTAKLTYISNYTRFENYTPETGVFEDTGN
ncbi:replicative DNA helicase [Candidatus Binatus soli]|uniref:replicative DNA helicase n=1 Tax=Candidatus Binatus soli TaxID=1953413 RepID=UPI003D11F1F8